MKDELLVTCFVVVEDIDEILKIDANGQEVYVLISLPIKAKHMCVFLFNKPS